MLQDNHTWITQILLPIHQLILKSITCFITSFSHLFHLIYNVYQVLITVTARHVCLQALQEPQWIQCDVRDFRFDLLGKFGVIMTDPPWEIRQDLPYGTMSDEEMLHMPIAELQDDGVIFMWVVSEYHVGYG